MTTLHDRFTAQAAKTPDAIALTFAGQNLTYGELDRRANQLANQLRFLGVGPESLVGLLLDRSLELVVGILGILKAGGAYVPLDPSAPRERLAFQLADCAAPVLVTRTGLPLPETDAIQVLLDTLDGPDTAPLSGATGENLAYVIYTSGSTGKPKGCLVEHRNVLPLFNNPAFAATESDVWTLFHSYAFDFSVWEIWGALLFGGRLVIPTEAERRAGEAFHALLRREGVTILNQSPTAFTQLMLADSHAPKLTSLRTVILAAEKLEVASLKPWFARYGDNQPLLWNLYGITETTVFVSYRRITATDTDSTNSPIGVAFPGWDLHVLDGELWVGGVGVTRGYLNRPELTAERFVEHEGQRVYKSGDLVRVLENGELDYIGRADLQVKLRGHRIELGEIESALCHVPGIRGAAVVLADDRLVAFTLGEEVPTATLTAALRESLPAYMVPTQFVRLESFPMTVNGKLDRKVLMASLPVGLPPSPRPAGGNHGAEGWVLALWQKVIGTDAPLSPDDAFFDIGGHSLLLAQVREAIQTQFGVELSVVELFEYPTAQALAQRIAAGNSQTPQNHGIRERALRQREATARLRRH